MNSLNRLIKNEYIYSIITRFFVIFISLIQSIIIARYFGAALKGTSAYISSIASIGSIIITFGMHQAYPYFRKKYENNKILENYINLTYFLYLAYFCCAIALGVFVIKSIELKAVTIMIPIFGYSTVVGYVCLIEKPNIRNRWWTIIAIFECLLTIILWVTTTGSLFWVIFILIFADAIKALIYSIELGVKPKLPKGLMPLLKEVFAYGFFPMVALLLTMLNYRIDILMLKQFSFITSAQIGVYSIGISFAEKIVLIPDTLGGILASKLAKGADQMEVVRISRICFWASFGMCIVFLLLGGWAIPFIYGKEYAGAFSVVVYSAIGSLSIGYFKLISQYNIINRKQIRNVLMLSVAIIVDIVGNLIFVPIWGINGAAFATGLGNFVCGVVFAVWFTKHVNVQPSLMIIPQKSDFLLIKSYLRKNR